MASSLLGLAPGGGYLAIRITANAGGLLRHLFTITSRNARLFVSVALFRQVRSLRRLPRPGCYPTPCSLECGLSSTPQTQGRDRPTDLRRVHHTRKGKERQQLSKNSRGNIGNFGVFPPFPNAGRVRGSVKPAAEKIFSFPLNQAPPPAQTDSFENGENLIGDFTKRH